MNAEDRERQIEQWLDTALASHSQVEPRTGLESRILANLEAHQQARRSWWQWAWIPVAAAVVIAASVLWMMQEQGTRTAGPSPATDRNAVGGPPLTSRTPVDGPPLAPLSGVQAGNNQRVGAPTIAARNAEKRENAKLAARHYRRVQEPVLIAGDKEPLPRKDVFPSRDGAEATFPSPSAVNAQEVALMTLVKGDPEEVRIIAQRQESDRQALAKMFQEAGVPQR